MIRWDTIGLICAFALSGVAVGAPGCVLDTGGRLAGPADGGGVAGPCVTDFDCEAPSLCETPRCSDGRCEFLPQGLGTPCGDNQQLKCDGQGRCVACVGPGDCAAGLCVDAVKEGGERCEDGTCVPNDATPCEPYQCNSAGDNCRTDCADNGVNDCAENYLCNQDGICVDGFEQGHPCGPGQCASGFCADGVCCDTACDRACEQCVESATGAPDGTCAPLSPFTDPKALCADDIGCGDDGTCAMCGFAPDAPGDQNCPAVCTGGCSNVAPFICTVTCDDTNATTTCDGSDVVIDCPVGWHCLVDCINDNACRDATINCPEAYDCRVECADANHACQRTNVVCSENGPCQMACDGGNTCVDATFECRHNACTAQCDGDDDPAFNDNDTACAIDCNL